MSHLTRHGDIEYGSGRGGSVFNSKWYGYIFEGLVVLQGTIVQSPGRSRNLGDTTTTGRRLIISGFTKPVKSQITIAPCSGWYFIAMHLSLS